MGFLDTLKALFKEKQEELEVNEVKLEKLGSWLDSWIEDKAKNAKSELKIIKREIREEQEKVTENLEKLEKAELMNSNIPEKVKHILEGNRKTYLHKVNLVSSKVELPEDFNEILSFCKNFDNYLEEFWKSTFRPYKVLQEFFANESKSLAANVAKLDSLVKKAKGIVEKSVAGKIGQVKESIQKTNQQINRKAELIEKINNLEKEIKEKSELKVGKEEKIVSLKESDDYQMFLALKVKKNSTQQEIEQLERNVSLSFSMINTALKKYERLTLDSALVRKYLDKPLPTLFSDTDLKIVDLLTKMKESVKGNKVDLKEKKKEKTVAELEKMDKDYFKTFFATRKRLKEKLNEVNSNIESIVLVKDLELLGKDVDNLAHEVVEDNDELDFCKNELSTIDIDTLKMDLGREISKSLGIRLVVN